MYRMVLAAFVVAFWGLSLDASAQELPKSVAVVATVNEVAITLDQFKTLRAGLSSSDIQDLHRAKDPDGALLEDLVQSEALAQLAIELGLPDKDRDLQQVLKRIDSFPDPVVRIVERRVALMKAMLTASIGNPDILVTSGAVQRHYNIRKAYKSVGLKAFEEEKPAIRDFLMYLASRDTAQFLHAQAEVQYYRERIPRK